MEQELSINSQEPEIKQRSNNQPERITAVRISFKFILPMSWHSPFTGSIGCNILGQGSSPITTGRDPANLIRAAKIRPAV
ncbi:MAG: hypothetical protein L2C94_007275 [Aigarchaeota archaeon]|nr:hypothetical protein [Candidatus Wolframiiraptor gerlachensis]